MEVTFSHWSAAWPVLISYAVIVTAHLTGLLRLLAGGPTGGPAVGSRQELVREALLFHAGLLIVLLSLVSPIGYWSGVYIWVRALQTVLVGLVGPGFIAIGAPWPALRQSVRRGAGTAGRPRAAASRGPASRGPASRGPASRGPAGPRWRAAGPLLAVIAFNLAWLGWQLPVLFDAARGSSGLALAEHVSYIGLGVLFWLQLFGSRPLSPTAGVLRRLAFVVGTVIVTTILGMILVFGNGVSYPVYAGAAHHVMTVLDDQQLSGAVLWMGSLPPLIVAGVALLIQWLNNEETAELSAGLDRLITPRNNAWPSRPVIR